jgi:hypothetical protein
VEIKTGMRCTEVRGMPGKVMFRLRAEDGEMGPVGDDGNNGVLGECN